jgi:quercetin dioxygenase-like cupin family protein
MLTRRSFSACALCAIGGFSATEVQAQDKGQITGTQTGGVTRTIITQMDVPNSDYVTVIATAEIPAGAKVTRHTHPGVESGYVIDGDGTLTVEGGQEIAFKPGTHFQVPPDTPHMAQGGSKATKLSLVYTVVKGKPLASPA